MEIIVGKTAGFCFGVKNAVTKSVEQLEKNKQVYCLGELVHNKQVTEELIQKGMNFIENIEEGTGKVIIRSHGVTKNVYEKAKQQKIELIDLTCPKVLKTHNIAKEYAEKNFFVFVVGKKEHPEMIGTVSFCGENYAIIEEENEVAQAINNFNKSNKKEAVLIAQTTYSIEKFNKIASKLKEQISNLEIKNTICNATKERQEETEKIAKQVQQMIIIGGKHSSNSNKLYEVAKKYCTKVIFIETEKELDLSQIKNIDKIGIMAGASTPTNSIEKVIEKISNI